MDVSDRGGRGDNLWVTTGSSESRMTPSHHWGPFIVPKEFVPNPRNMSMRFALNGETLQEGNTSQVIHEVFELIACGSNILRLRPGDVIGTGTPTGVGSARTPPIYLKDGDRSVCPYAGVGTLTNPVVGPSVAPVAT